MESIKLFVIKPVTFLQVITKEINNENFNP